jgi:hypothetical protein
MKYGCMKNKCVKSDCFKGSVANTWQIISAKSAKIFWPLAKNFGGAYYLLYGYAFIKNSGFK